jgi:hypothetical protein
MTYRGHVRNGQITLDRTVPLPEGAEVSVEVLRPNGERTVGRRDLLRMSIDELRQLLAQQAERVMELYTSDADRSQWQGGDIVE